MKKLVLVCAVLFSVAVSMAQENKQDEFVKEGDLIKATKYHENGTVAQTGFYTLDNKLQGEWTSYDAEGNKTAVAHYNNGSKVGTWYFYQGDQLKEVNYSNSKIAKVTSFQVTDTRVVTY